MTIPFGGPGRNSPALPNLPTPPTGWPVGSFATYEEAQRSVDYLADQEFPVGDVTIVGVDLMLVERVIGRLTWGRVIGSGAASGVWMGLFVGALLAYSNNNSAMLAIGLVGGVVFSVIFAAISYAATRGKRDFTSSSQLVAGRYDVLSHPRNAERAKEVLAKLAMGPRSGPDWESPTG
ncbi:MAG: magnesium transporter [Pseudonocardia sp.]|nr:magnesium transporter [Pseudonocardia sp.]